MDKMGSMELGLDPAQDIHSSKTPPAHVSAHPLCFWVLRSFPPFIFPTFSGVTRSTISQRSPLSGSVPACIYSYLPIFQIWNPFSSRSSNLRSISVFLIDPIDFSIFPASIKISGS